LTEGEKEKRTQRKENRNIKYHFIYFPYVVTFSSFLLPISNPFSLCFLLVEEKKRCNEKHKEKEKLVKESKKIKKRKQDNPLL